jgi:hypothetical protein
MIQMKHCEYCAKEISYYEQYCGKRCEEQAGKYYSLTRNKRKLFSFINFTGLLALTVGLFWTLFQAQVGAYIAGTALVFLGLLYFFFPFGTPDMLQKFKIQKTIKIVKIIGSAAIVLGVAAIVLGLTVLAA